MFLIKSDAKLLLGPTLKPFWKRLRPTKAKIEAVAMDMSKAYWGAVMTYLSKAKVVFDHFHVIKLFNDKKLFQNPRQSLFVV